MKYKKGGGEVGGAGRYNYSSERSMVVEGVAR